MIQLASTCTCSPEIPWYCDHCLAARRIRHDVLAEARTNLKSLRADRKALDDCASTGHQSDLCHCAGQPHLTAAQMYRYALTAARANVAARHQLTAA